MEQLQSSTYSKMELKRLIKESYSLAFCGPGQNLDAYDAAIYYESLLRDITLKELEIERNALRAHIISQEAQDEMAMIKLDRIEQKIKDLNTIH